MIGVSLDGFVAWRRYAPLQPATLPLAVAVKANITHHPLSLYTTTFFSPPFCFSLPLQPSLFVCRHRFVSPPPVSLNVPFALKSAVTCLYSMEGLLSDAVLL